MNFESDHENLLPTKSSSNEKFSSDSVSISIAHQLQQTEGNVCSDGKKKGLGLCSVNALAHSHYIEAISVLTVCKQTPIKAH